MSAENLAGLVLAVLITGYLLVGPPLPGAAVMTAASWLQFTALIVLVVAATPPLGSYMAKVFGGGKAPGDRLFNPVERILYKLTGVDPEREQPSRCWPSASYRCSSSTGCSAPRGSFR